MSDTDNWVNWNCDYDHPYDSKDKCTADVEPGIERDDGMQDPKSPEQWDVSAAPNVPGSLWLIRMSKRQNEMVLVTVNTMEIRRNKGIKKK